MTCQKSAEKRTFSLSTISSEILRCIVAFCGGVCYNGFTTPAVYGERETGNPQSNYGSAVSDGIDEVCVYGKVEVRPQRTHLREAG